MSQPKMESAVSVLVDITTILAQLAFRASEVSTIIQAAQAAGRDLTEEEMETVFVNLNSAIARLREANKQAKQ